MSIYAIPSLLALAIKAWLFVVAGKPLVSKNPALAFFLCSLFGVNSAEFIFFTMTSAATNLMPILLVYYAAAVYAVAAFVLLALNLYGARRWLGVAVMFLASVIVFMIILTDWIVADVVRTSLSMTRVAGELYWVVQLFFLTALVAGMAMLLYVAFRSENIINAKRGLAMLVGTLPVVLSALLVVVGMKLGLQLNGAVIISTMSTVTVALLVYVESRYRLFLFLSYVPYTRENEIRKRVVGLVRESVEALFRRDGELDMKSISAKFETALIEMAIEATGGNKTHAAQVLQIGKATLHRKLAKA